MNILYLTMIPYEAVNSAMIRNLSLIKGLASLNCQVDLVVIADDGRTRSSKFNVDGLQSLIVLNNNDQTKHKHLPKKEGLFQKYKIKARKIVSSLWHKLSPFDYTISYVNKVSLSDLPRTNYDYIISSSDPKSSHLVMKKYISKGLRYKKWIQYWGDPLATDVSSRMILPFKHKLSIERSILKGADVIVYVSPFTAEEQRQLFPEMSVKMSFIPIPYFQERIAPTNRKDRFLVSYVGDYYSRNRNIIPLYSACKQACNVDLYVIGDSDLDLSAASNVHFSPRQDTEVEYDSDLVICLMNIAGTQIPGKIYQLAGTNKKILVILDGENKDKLREYLSNYNRFYFCNNNIDDILSAIEYIQLHPQDNLSNSPVKSLSSEYIANEFLRILGEIND